LYSPFFGSFGLYLIGGVSSVQDCQVKQPPLATAFVYKFVRYVGWQSFTGGLSQFWLQVREESRKS